MKRPLLAAPLLLAASAAASTFSDSGRVRSFGADDPTFVTAPAAGSVTQTATATFSYISYKFFKAAIHAYLPDDGDEPWEEPEEPGEEEP